MDDKLTQRAPIHYARQACDTMMRKFKARDLPPKGHFHYHQGVFLSGVYQTYLHCKEEKYFTYMKDWVDSCIDEEGNVLDFCAGHLDDIQPGILLFPLWRRTGGEKYKKALEGRIRIVEGFPRNAEGGFWHMDTLPGQMWLDGLYMAGPFTTEYACVFNRMEYLDIAIGQALLMKEKTQDLWTGLWYHAWDSLGKEDWADDRTGRSPEFWGRSIGWVPVAILNELDHIPSGHEKYQDMCGLVRNLLQAVCNYQSEDGRWYQVVDKGGMEGNWLENSCSCLFIAALCKATEKGILDKSYLLKAQKGYKGVIRDLTWEGDDIRIGNVCIGTGVGDYRHYCERPVSVNDLHGLGAFLLMCTQMQRMV
jgi:unsaturated rhamnogalacturonyl hydrolase